jgi:predicted ATPase
MITRVYIDNFRCFSNFEFKPDKMNLLIGLNGTGKSSFIELISKLLELVLNGQEVSRLFVADDLTKWDSRVRQKYEIDVNLAGAKYSYTLSIEHDIDNDVVSLIEERVTCGGKNLFRYESGIVHLHRNDGSEGTQFAMKDVRSFLSQIEERPETRDLLLFLEYLRGIHIQKLDPTRISSISQEENQALQADGSNFASWYRHISQERMGDLTELFANLKKAIPDFHSLALIEAGKQGRTRELVVKLRSSEGSTYMLDFRALSDGQRILIILFTLLIEFNGGTKTLLLDEPENYVSLPEIQPWLVQLDDALGDDGQLLLISHHPEVIDFLAPERSFLFERPDAGPVRVKESDFDRGNGLKASEQISRLHFGAGS